MSDLPEGWMHVPLSDLGDWYGGGTPSKSNPDYWTDGSIPWLTPKDMGQDVVEGTQDRITEKAVAESSVRLVPDGSVAIVVRSGILERVLPVGLVPFPTTLNQDMKALHPRPEVLPEWVAWGIRAGGAGLLDSVRKSGTTVASIETSRLMSTCLPIPPLEDQRRIVAILEDHLSRLDAAVKSAERAKAKSETLERGILERLVLGRIGPGARNPLDNVTGLPHGWFWRTWPEVGASQNGRAFSSGLYQPDGVKLIRPGNLASDGNLTWTESNTRFLPESLAENHPDMIVGENEIVMNLTAQSLKDDFLGRVCLTGVGERSLLNQRLARLTPTGLDVRFAFLIFRSPIFRRFVSSLNTGSLIQHMFTKQLTDFSVPVPPRDEQIEITNFAEDVLSSVRRLRHCVEQQVNAAPLLRTSLLDAAFSGQLTRESISV